METDIYIYIYINILYMIHYDTFRSGSILQTTATQDLCCVLGCYGGNSRPTAIGQGGGSHNNVSVSMVVYDNILW